MNYEDMINNIILGDCYELIRNIPDNSIDLIITDPPYDFHCGSINASIFKNRLVAPGKEIVNMGINNGYDLKSKYYITSTNKNDKDKFKHPTIKPIEIIEKQILHTTKESDIVLDCFCGSGTTCVACKNNDRRYIGIEINEEYYEIAKKRLNGMTADGQLSIFTDTEKMVEK